MSLLYKNKKDIIYKAVIKDRKENERLSKHHSGTIYAKSNMEGLKKDLNL